MSVSGGTRRGDLFVIAAPSGAGKTTLVRALLERDPTLEFSTSYTTRKRRSSERDGIDYFFVTEDEFERMVADGEFLEHARVFDHWYGTGRDYVESRRRRGKSVLLEIDWQGARQVRESVADAKTIFILPPSIGALKERLVGRATDSDETIARRLRDSLSDMRHWPEFDYVVVNDDIATAVDELAAIVTGHGGPNQRDVPEVRRRAERILASQKGLQ